MIVDCEKLFKKKYFTKSYKIYNWSNYFKNVLRNVFLQVCDWLSAVMQ